MSSKQTKQLGYHLMAVGRGTVVKCRAHLICVSLTQAVPCSLYKCILPNFTSICRSKTCCQSVRLYLFSLFSFTQLVFKPLPEIKSLPAHINGPLSLTISCNSSAQEKVLLITFTQWTVLLKATGSNSFFLIILHIQKMIINTNVSPVTPLHLFSVLIMHRFFFQLAYLCYH